MAEPYALGVDLGTTFTAAAVVRGGRASVVNLGNKRAEIPSVVLVREDKVVLTGEAAERRAVSEPDRVGREFKRRLGDTTPLLLGGAAYSAEQLMARLLRAVVDDVRSREGGEPAAIAITHPANWGPYKTDLLEQAVQIAELGPVTLMTEPEAAAVSYAHANRLEPGEVIAVYDLGGGTFDAAVLRSTDEGFELLGTPVGIERLGGIDFDAAVMGHVLRVLGDDISDLDEDDPAVMLAFGRLRKDAVEARETLSADTEVDIPVMLPGVASTVRLTRVEFEEMIRPAVEDSVAALRRALDSAGVTADDLGAVLLVGGASRTPLVAGLVGSALGRPVVVDADPKHAVSTGAAFHAAALAAGTSELADVAADVVAAVPETGTATQPTSLGGAPPDRALPSGREPVASDPPRVPQAALAAVLAVAVLLGGFFVLRSRGSSGEQAGGGPGQMGEQTVASAFVRATIDEGSMALVDRTDPIVGTDDHVSTLDPPEYAAAYQVPGRLVAYVDVDATTNRQYYDYVSFTSVLPGADPATVWANEAPPAWQALSGEVPASFSLLGLPEDEPVVGVSWESADAFCTYALKRLVREVEWELAAVAGLIDVGGQQNWVARPEDYAAVPDGARVLRGSFGIEDLPVHFRTIGDSPANRINAGIRCAADDVVEVPRPTGQTLYVREFSPADEAFDWPDFHDAATPQMAFGYHAPDVFHIEVRDERRLSVFSGRSQGSRVSVQADAQLRLPDPPFGAFRYGLVANAGTRGHLTFTLQPRDAASGEVVSWCITRHSAPVVVSGVLFAVTPAPADACEREGTVPWTEARRSTLRIEFGDREATFFVDGLAVDTMLVAPDPEGTFGFVTENFDPNQVVHIHFDNLVVQAL